MSHAPFLYYSKSFQPLPSSTELNPNAMRQLFKTHVGCLDHFHTLVIANSSAMSKGLQSSPFLRLMARGRTFGFYDSFLSAFEESPCCLLLWLHQVTFPATVQESSPFSTSSPTFVVSCLLDS